MTDKEIKHRFEDLSEAKDFVCTQTELEDFVDCGCVIMMGDKYVTREGKILKISVLQTKTYRMSIDLTGIISDAMNKSKTTKCKRLYYMTADTLEKYKNLGFIIECDNNIYYQRFIDEKWLVILI